MNKKRCNLITRSLLLSALYFLVPVLLPAQTTLSLPYGTKPVIDGIISGAEWADADSLSINVGSNRTSIVKFKHDCSNLHVAFLGNLQSMNIRAPEILLDVNKSKSPVWEADDFWFHVSATDCSSQGVYGDYTNCKLVQPNWTAHPNMANGGKPADTMEIQIPFATVGIALPKNDTIGLCFLLTNTFNIWNYSHNGASKDSPQSWMNAVFMPCSGTSQRSEEGEEQTAHIYPNPTNDVLHLVTNANARGKHFGVYNQLGRKVIGGIIDANILPISVTELAKGVYFLRIEGANTPVLRFTTIE